MFYREPLEERFLRILSGIASNAAIPPIWVNEKEASMPGPRYRLANGFHRVHSSIAVGFGEIGIVVLPPEPLRPWERRFLRKSVGRVSVEKL